MKPIAKMNQLELAAFVQEHLRKHGVDSVLTGGSAVTLYSQNRYVSRDVDLIILSVVHRRALRQAMEEIGFVEQGRHFVHPESPYIVEFPAGPLAVGKEPVREVRDVVLSTGRLRVISPTDCVKDRLAAFYHWGDRQALEQAALVCRHQSVDLDEVARWSQAEGADRQFRFFLQYLEEGWDLSATHD